VEFSPYQRHRQGGVLLLLLVLREVPAQHPGGLLTEQLVIGRTAAAYRSGSRTGEGSASIRRGARISCRCCRREL
jgi:hypothetical protein